MKTHTYILTLRHTYKIAFDTFILLLNPHSCSVTHMYECIYIYTYV